MRNVEKFLVLLGVVVVWCATLAIAQAQDVTAGLHGQWFLTETSGTSATDSSTFSNNGTYTGGVSLSSSPPVLFHGVQAATFDGSTGYVAIPNHSHFNVTGSFSVCAWIRVGSFDKEWQTIVAKGDSAWRLSRNGQTNTLHFSWGAHPDNRSVNSTISVNDGQWHHVVGIYDGSSMRIYVDGVLNNSASASGSVATNSYAVTIGSNAERPGREWNGSIYDVRVYNRALTANEVVQVAVQGKPIAHWKLDELDGTTAIDEIGIFHGTYQNNVTPGVSGGPLYAGNTAAHFGGGTNDRVQVPAVDVPGAGITIASWFKPESFGDMRLVSKATDTAVSAQNWILGIANNSQLRARVKINGTTQAIDATVVPLIDGRWYHAALTYDGSSMRVYLDGVEVGSGSWSGTITPDSSVAVALGNQPSGAGDRAFHGTLDDVRIYPFGMSATEIAKLYGLIGRWKLSEASGSTALDSSPMSNHGTYTSTTLNTIGPYPGEGSAAANFNNVGRVTVPNESLYDITETISVAAWIKVDAFNAQWQAIATKGDSTWRLQREGNTNRLMFGGEGLSPLKVVGTIDVNDGKWHHVVGTYDGSHLRLYVDGQLDNAVSASGKFNTNNFNVWIGANADKTGRNWNGPMHDVRVYNRPLALDEIVELYGLVGYWKLDESSGSTANDASGNEHHGIYQNNVTKGVSAPPLYSGNTAAHFGGGSNDRVQIPSLDVRGSGLTIASWFKPDSFGDRRFLSKAFSTNVSDHTWMLGVLSNSQLRARLKINQTTRVLEPLVDNMSVGTWYHAAMTYDGSTMRVYLDGAEVGSGSWSGTVTPRASTNVAIGNQPTGAGDRAFAGALDDVRLYNRPLWPEDIEALYHGGLGAPGVRIIRWVEIR